MNVMDFRAHVLGLANALSIAAESSTTETWPTERDKVLEKFDCKELSFLTRE